MQNLPQPFSFFYEVIVHWKKRNYNDRYNDDKAHCTEKANFKTPKMQTTPLGLGSIRWMGPVISSFVSENMKNVKSLERFKKEIK